MHLTMTTSRKFQTEIRIGGLLSLLSMLTVPRYISSFIVPSGITSRSQLSKKVLVLSRQSPMVPSLCHPISPATTTTKLFMSTDSNFQDSNDPFQVLGLNEPTSDLKVIRRAYKRMALKYHPDVATTKDSTPEEKKLASERFAKINWAYETLSGKRKDDTTYGKAKTGTAGSTAGSNSWTPPHRRSAGSYSSSSSTQTTPPSWEDFMPKYDDEQYDTGGDSFEKIFTDLFVGAAAGAAGIGGGPSIFKDFVEFLEGNVDMGFGVSSSDDDSELRILLATGSIEEIGNEMDDTELVIESLKSKKDSIVGEIMDRQADLSLTNRYIEKMDLEANIAELQARKDVVDGYLKKAQKRLVKIQNRYKALIVSGQNDTYARGGSSSPSSSSWRDNRTESGSSSARAGTRASSSSSSSSSNSGNASASSSDSSKSSGDSWMDEGFGSSSAGRRRASSRRSRSNRNYASSSSGGSSSSSKTESQSRTNSSSSQSSRREPVRPPPSSATSRRPTASPTPSRPTRTTPISTDVPPHRRRQTTFQSEQETKRRLRDLKVDDEFEKLKKDLGL